MATRKKSARKPPSRRRKSQPPPVIPEEEEYTRRFEGEHPGFRALAERITKRLKGLS